MSNDLSVFEFDNTLDWVIQRFGRNTLPFFSFTVDGNDDTYIIDISKYFSIKSTFPKMTVKNQENELFFEKKIKAGLQYEINDDIAIYFQILNIDINTIIDTRNYQNVIYFGYAII